MRKKIYYGLGLWLLLAVPQFAVDSRCITVNYSHSMRIPYHLIEIKLSEHGGKYIMHVETRAAAGSSGFEYSNTKKDIAIEKSYFDKLYNKILKLKFQKIILENEDNTGLDGYQVSLTVGNFQNNLCLYLWSPENLANSPNTNEAVAIIREIVKKADLEKWL